MLSGGELARAHVARMMLETADLLVLDEPTNDLDIPTLEVLEDAIETFSGATLLVTHDRAMLEALATRIVVLGAPDGTPRVVASLAQALRALAESEEAAAKASAAAARASVAAAKASVAAAKATAATASVAAAAKPAPPAPTVSAPVAASAKKKLSYNEQREFELMEAAIAAAEKKHADLDARLKRMTGT
jgi:ATP-binding cassette subfamily F protein uup